MKQIVLAGFLALCGSLCHSFFLSSSMLRADEAQVFESVDFEPYPEKIDMLVVVAHPDDESTMGGLLPHYAHCQGKKIVFVSLTSGEWGNGLPHHESRDQLPDYSYDDSDYPRFEKIPENALYPCYYREGELTRMLWMSGVKYKPILPRFQDKSGLQPWGTPDPALNLWGGEDKVVGWLVEKVRRFRPDVIVSMAKDGYNGNPQHMSASYASVMAGTAAADDGRFRQDSTATPDASGEPWQVSKIYLVVSEGETYDQTHSHRWDSDCRGDLGKAQVMAARANAMHESQEMKEECPASTDFVLVHSTVGPDLIQHDDLFENVYD